MMLHVEKEIAKKISEKKIKFTSIPLATVNVS